MAVGTQVERLGMTPQSTRSRIRTWMVGAGIAIAALAGTGTFFAVSGSEEPASIPAVSSPVGDWVDPGVEARQDALKRYHQDSASPPKDASLQGALKRYHEDAKG